MHRSVLLGVVMLVVLATGAGVTAGLLETESESQPEPGELVGSSTELTSTSTSQADRNVDEPEFDRTYFEITVQNDGSAEWTFRYERLLTSTEERDQFEQFAEQFEEDETEFYEQFTEQATALVAMGEDTTDREMSADAFDRNASVESEINERGVVEMSFTWTNFAAVDDEGWVVISDVFDGWFFLMDDQSLEITAGDGLVFEEVRPDQPDAEYGAQDVRDATTVTWRGEQEFIEGHPYVVLVPEGDVSADGDGSDASWFNSTLLAGGLVLALIVGLGAIAYARYDRTERTAHEGDSPSSTTDSKPPDSAESQIPVTEDELLSDEDRVEALIRQNGGRMKQVNIVDETGWSKSKVSMLLSDMEEEDRISKLRVGRENIISLEGFEPEATKSPFDE